MRKLFCILTLLSLAGGLDAQSRATDIYRDIKGLNVFARVLFVAMAPGDQDAQLAAYLSKQAHCDVGLLCLTRGEKMPNYAGYEKGVDLGIIHAQELVNAGATAGFRPMTTCAMDLGNYGSAKDIFSVWDENALMSNLVWAIRYFRPDIIITPYNSGGDSGRALITAWIAEANKRAGSKAYDTVRQAGLYKYLDTACAKQVYWDVPDSLQGNRNGYIPVFTNQIDEASGRSFKEIARQSYLCERSIFKDLDRLPARKDTQYLKPLLPASGSLFENIDTSWARTGNHFQDVVNAVLRQYDFLHPEKSIPALAALYTRIGRSGITGFWKKIKLQQLQDIILSCSGLSVEAACDKPVGIIGQDYMFRVSLEDNTVPVTIDHLVISDSVYTADTTLGAKSSYLLLSKVHIPFTRDAYQPFWLNKTIDGKHQMYTIDDAMAGRLADTACYAVTVFITVDSLPLSIKLPVVYSRFDRLNGAVCEPFYIIEPVQVSQKPVVLLTNVTGDTRENKSTDVTLKFSPLFDGSMFTILEIMQTGGLSLTNDQGSVTGHPDILYKLDSIINFKKNDIFKINVPFDTAKKATTLMPSVLMNFSEGGQDFDANIKELNYPYLPFILYNYHDQTKIVSDAVKTKGKRVAYLFGLPDDNLSTALLQLGYKTDLLDLARIQPDSLAKYDAIIIGDYMPVDREGDTAGITNAKFYLGNYVYKGGTLICLTGNNAANVLLPYPLVTTSGELMYDPRQCRLMLDDSLLFDYPNHIHIEGIAKWEGSLVDRVPAQYDAHYKPQLSIVSLQGNRYCSPVLSAKSGKGKVIYCNLNIASQAMDAQADAFRLLANFIAATRPKNR